MWIALVIALGAVVQVGSPAPTRALTSDEAAAAAPVHATFERVRLAQAALPAPTTDAERLIRMRELDQAGRAALVKVDTARLTPDGRKQVMAAVWTEILRQDREDQTALLKMLPAEGWFTRSRYGPDASHAAFLIVQHGDVALWRRFVPVLEPLVAKGEVAGSDYALMFDRLAMFEGRPQRYGSQLRCEAGELKPAPIETPAELDARRRSLGLTQPEATYVEVAKAVSPPCP